MTRYLGRILTTTIILLGSINARSRVLLEATTTVYDKELSETTTLHHMEQEVQFLEDIEDVGLDNTEVNCHKCLKASFKFRKELFCKKCLKKGMLSPDKAPQDNCKKCRKPKYFEKHSDYCEMKCSEYSPAENVTTEESVEITTTSAPDLGPLGNLFKLLVQANTWQ